MLQTPDKSTCYLHTPVKDAQIQLELGGTKVEVKPDGEGEFHVVLAQALKPGLIPVTATVSAGADSDLLAGELDLHGAVTGERVGHTHSYKEYAGWIAAALLSLAGLAWGARRHVMRRRSASKGSLT